MASPFDPLYQDAGKKWDVDPLLLRAQAIVESSENPNAVSPKGAGGLMQIMPATAKSLGVANVNAPDQAIPGAAALTNENLLRYTDPATGRPDINKALMAYHGGPDQSKWGPLTQAYPGKVAAVYQQLKAQQTAQGDAPAVRLTGGQSAPQPARSLTVSAAAPRLSDLNDDELAARLTQGATQPTPAPAPAQTKPMAQMSDDELVQHLTAGIPPAGTAAASLTGGTPAAPLVANAIKMTPPAEGRLPGAATQAAASLPTDPAARARVMAAQLFPNLPPDQAAARVGYAPDGRMVAVDPQGRPFYAEAARPSITGMSGFSPGNLAGVAASWAGPALPIAGSVLGGIASSPTSLLAGPAMAGAGAGAGDALRQYLARQFDPQGGQIQWNPYQTAQEAALGAAGQATGAVVNRFLSPNLLGVSRTDRAAATNPAAMAKAQTAYSRAHAQGVDLSVGQATGLPSLLAREDAATNLPFSMDAARDFYRNQGLQIDAAGQRMLGGVSPLEDKTDAALAFQEAAPNAIREARQASNAAARPSYQAAEAVGAAKSPALETLAQQPTIQTAMERAGKIYQDLYRKPPPAEPDFALWDLTKRALDDMHTSAVRNPTGLQGPTSAMGIDSLRGDLVGELDKAYPTYATARETAAPGLRLASRLQDSIGNAGTGTEKARAIVAPVFDSNNPRAIVEARNAFDSAGRIEDWNAGVRSYLQDAFDRASMSQQGLNPSMLRRQIWGNADRREAMRAAMTPEQFKGFDNFMGTIEDAAKTYPVNSLTTPRKMAVEDLMNEAANTSGQNLIRTIGKMLSFRATNLLSDAANAATAGATRRNAQAMLERAFSPDGMEYLRAMSAYKPGTQQAITATSRFLAQISPAAVPALAAGRFDPESHSGQRFGGAYDAVSGLARRLLAPQAAPAQ